MSSLLFSWNTIWGDSGRDVVTDASDWLERDLLSAIAEDSIFHVSSEVLLEGTSIFLSDSKVSKFEMSLVSKSSVRNPGLYAENSGSMSPQSDVFVEVLSFLRLIDFDACRILFSCGIVKLASFICKTATEFLVSNGSSGAKERLGVKFDFN